MPPSGPGNSLQISGGDNLDMEYLEQFYIFIVLRQQLVFLNKYIYFSLNQVYIFFSEPSCLKECVFHSFTRL